MSRTTDIVEAAATRLETDLPTRCVTEGIASPVEVLRYRPERAIASKCPQLWVSTGTSARSTDGRDGASIRVYVQVFSVMVGVFVAGQNPGAVESLRQVYADVIRQCIEANDWVNGLREIGTAVNIEWEETEPQANFTEDNALFQETILTFRWCCLIQRGVD